MRMRESNCMNAEKRYEVVITIWEQPETTAARRWHERDWKEEVVEVELEHITTVPVGERSIA